MALHRDIFWIGRQWAVTGVGIQAVDQRRYGAFDVDMSKIWDGAAFEALRQQAWLDAADFEKALTTARARFPASPAAAALPNSVPDVAQPLKELQPNQALSVCVRSARAKFLPQWRLRQ